MPLTKPYTKQPLRILPTLGIGFFSAFSLLCAPVAPWDAYRRGSSHCISWFQIELTLTTCHVRYHTELWDNRSIGLL